MTEKKIKIKITQEYLDGLIFLIMSFSYTDLSTLQRSWPFAATILVLGVIYIILRFFGFKIIKEAKQ